MVFVILLCLPSIKEYPFHVLASTSSSIWLPLEPKGVEGMWYENLPKIPSIEKILSFEENAVTNAMNKEKCLMISKNSTTDGFTISSEDCSKKLRVVCKLNQTLDEALVSVSSPPQFPCIPKSSRRRKRKSGGYVTHKTISKPDELRACVILQIFIM